MARRGKNGDGNVAVMEVADRGSKVKEEAPVRIFEPSIEIAKIRLIGQTSLIMNRWTESAIAELEAGQQGKKVKSKDRPPRVPEREYRDSAHVISGVAGQPGAVYGFPGAAILAAMSTAATSFTNKQLSGKLVKGALAICEDFMPIEFAEMRMRKDMANQRGTGTVRYRSEFTKWSARPTIRYNPTLLSLDEIVNLLNLAGISVGIGAWRVEKRGHHGIFIVDRGPGGIEVIKGVSIQEAIALMGSGA